MNTVKIGVSPLYQNPPAILSEDLLGERALNAATNERLERATQTGPVAEENARIASDRERLTAGYFRDGQYIGQFAGYPRIPRKDNQR